MTTRDSEISPKLQIPGSFWAVMVLGCWVLAISALIERSAYGLDEATARVLVLLWSIADAVASPVLTLGMPDARALYLIPAAAFFSGSLLAAKLWTAASTAALTTGLYHWRSNDGDAEAALLAAGLFLLAPATLSGVDQIAIGPFLLLSLLLGVWADLAYRRGRVRFSGSYFAQVLLSAAAVDLHPAGLAYPLVVGWAWLRAAPPEPAGAALVPGSERVHMLLGLGLGSALGALLAAGWPQQTWLHNPVLAAAQYALGLQPASAPGWAWAGGLILLGCALALAYRLRLWRQTSASADRLAAVLVLACSLGLVTGDRCFGLMLLAFVLFWGFPALLRLRLVGGRGFIGQRGAAMVLVIVLATFFLSAARARIDAQRTGPILSVQDRLLRSLVESLQALPPGAADQGLEAPAAGAHRDGPRIASQWPGRTTLLCRCSVLPLPPASADQGRFSANLQGTDFVVFDPLDPINQALARNFALLGGASAETVALQAGGVVIRLRRARSPAAAPPPLGAAIRS